MPAPKRRRIEPTNDWQHIQLLIQWLEQLTYELIRPVVLFGRSAAERSTETGKLSRTIHRKADHFDAYGMASLFADFHAPQNMDRRSLPPHLRQIIVDRKSEYPTFTPHELATLCYVASGHRPSSHTVKGKAESWIELVASHEEFATNFNYQVHWAHRGRQSPAEVLGWVHDMQRDPAELHRIFYTTRFGRKLDKLGYIRFRHWRIYGEHGLAGKQAAVRLYGETLLLEFSDEPLVQYSVAYEPDRRHFREVVPRQLFETQYHSLQIALWELGEGEWLRVFRLPDSIPQAHRSPVAQQLALFA